MIPIIPDLADVQDEEIITTIAAPPTIKTNRVQTITELENDLHDQMGISAQVTRRVSSSHTRRFLHLVESTCLFWRVLRFLHPHIWKKRISRGIGILSLRH